MTAPCCSVAKGLDPKRLAKLDGALRGQDHPGFRKLSAEYGVSKSALERHKHKCLGFAATYETPPKADRPKDLPPVQVRKRAGPVSQGVPDSVPGTAAVPEVSQPDAARARAPEVAISAHSHEDRVLYVVSQMAAGTWDGPRDISTLAASWGLDRDTVRRIASEAALVCRVDRGTVEERRQASMGYWRRVYEEAMLAAAAPAEFDAPSKCLAVAASAQTGWDKAAGIYEDAKVVNNYFGDPKFREAARLYVETVQTVLDSAGALAERVRARLGADVGLDVIAAVLAEADAEIGERMRAAAQPAPMLPGGSG